MSEVDPKHLSPTHSVRVVSNMDDVLYMYLIETRVATIRDDKSKTRFKPKLRVLQRNITRCPNFHCNKNYEKIAANTGAPALLRQPGMKTSRYETFPKY